MSPCSWKPRASCDLSGGCVIKVPSDSGTRHSGRSIDCLVVSKNFRQCVKNVRVDTRPPWSAPVAIAFDVVRKPAKIQTWQLVTLPLLVPQAQSQCREKWLARHRAAEHAVPNNSPQEVAVARLFGPWVTRVVASVLQQVVGCL